MRWNLPIVDQPMPSDCAIAYVRTGSQVNTSIARTSAPGDNLRCRLCPLGHCTVGSGSMCLVVVRAKVKPEDAWLFARRDITGRGPLADDPRLWGRD